MVAAAIVLTAGLAILYILFGYPLLLAWLSKSRARAVRREPVRPFVSVIIAVHNGEQFVADKLRSVFAVNYPRGQMEVIVVSDGSTDGTETIVEQFAGEGVTLLRLPRGGKPAGVNAGIAASKGEILILTDVRQTLAADSIAFLVESFADPTVGTVSGEVLIRAGSTATESDIGLYWRFESWMRDRLSSIDSMFGATGPFYAIRRSLAVPIPPDILLDDMYLPLAGFFKGYRLIMDSRAKAYDYPMTLDREFRRKVRTLGGNYQILQVYPALLGRRNRMLFHFVSYKFARLLLPWFLIALAAASWWLAEPWRTLLLAGQGVFAAFAALDYLLPERSRLKRISSPVRAFVTMMVAVLCGLAVFFVPARSLWKVTLAGPAR